MPLSRRQFLYGSAAAGAGLFLSTFVDGRRVVRAVSLPTAAMLDPVTGIPKFETPMLIPPVMPRAGTKKMQGGKNGDVYEISVRQFQQQILPTGLPPTTVWGYGAVKGSGKSPLLIHNAPSLTIEAQAGRPVEVKWINELVDADGNYLPHLLPVDPTLHWANPPGGDDGTRHAPDVRARRRAGTPDPSRWSPTSMAPLASATRATATPRPGTCRRPATSRPATPRRGPGTTSSRARQRAATARPGGPDSRSSSTRT